MTTDPIADDARRGLLRHALATLAYRGGKVVRGAPSGFGAGRAGASTRTAVEALSHLGDLLDWGLWLARGKSEWVDRSPGDWDAEVARFFAATRALDDYLSSGEPLAATPEALLQEPIADALTHVGQLATLRRLAGSPVRGEDYVQAEIVAGRVGPEQSPGRDEFD